MQDIYTNINFFEETGGHLVASSGFLGSNGSEKVVDRIVENDKVGLVNIVQLF